MPADLESMRLLNLSRLPSGERRFMKLQGYAFAYPAHMMGLLERAVKPVAAVGLPRMVLVETRKRYLECS